MKKILLFLPVLFIALSLTSLVTSCAQPPEAEIMAAEDAIKSALNAGADDGSPRLLEKAQKLLQEAKMLSEKGDYKGAIQKAEYARGRAEKAEKNTLRLEEAEKEREAN